MSMRQMIIKKRCREEDVSDALDLAIAKRPRTTLKRLGVLEAEVVESRRKEQMYQEIITKLMKEVKTMKEILNGQDPCKSCSSGAEV